MTRHDALRFARENFDSGNFFRDLARRVAIPSDCQSSDDIEPLENYLEIEMRSTLEKMGFYVKVFANSLETIGPFLIAERIESPNFQTVLIYGHGDVVRGMDEKWANGRSPWKLTAEGNRWYGRGTADNKGQHSINIAALAAVMAARNGRLGFNVKILLETAEERGSPGLESFCSAYRHELSADVLIASDGPRLHARQPTVFFGSRGIVAIKLEADLRPEGHHSGNWGGLLRNPATTLAAAIESLVDGSGRIKLPALKPTELPASVRRALSNISIGEGAPGDPKVDHDWGELGMSPEEKVFGWNALEVLAMQAGDANRPVGAIPGRAIAHLQLRYVVGTEVEKIAAEIKDHFDRIGLSMVTASVTLGGKATRLDPEEAWPRWAVESIKKTTGKNVAVLPNLGGTLPNSVFAETLALPTVWVPHSYPACNQHAPNEHLLVDVAAEGIEIMTGLFWDLGDAVPNSHHKNQIRHCESIGVGTI